MSKWIKVSDGLPEDWESVLACTDNGQVRPVSWSSTYPDPEEVGKLGCWWDIELECYADPVLAWCRYPSIPEEIAALVSEAGKERSE